MVYSTAQRSAVKAHRQIGTFDKELLVFQELAEHPGHEFAGFHVPKLLDFHPELLVIEMELVIAPFVVDFTGATIGKRSSAFTDMSDEDLEEWEAEKIEAYGESDWELVQTVISCFSRLGIFLNDIHKGNIRIRNE